jgi:dihydrolipoamide dehydrogenase
MPHYNTVIIGTGPGGYVAAIRAAQLGLKTAVVEKEELGGTCLNWGCIPTKSWIVTAHLFEQIKRAKEYGIVVGEPQIDWPALVARKNKIVKQMTGGVKQLLSGRQVDIHKGTAKLTSANKIAIAKPDGGTDEITTDNIVLATGAHGWNPPGWALEGERVIGSKERSISRSSRSGSRSWAAASSAASSRASSPPSAPRSRSSRCCLGW